MSTFFHAWFNERSPRSEYGMLPIRAHRFLLGVPLHTVDVVELPGGRHSMRADEISKIVRLTGEMTMEVGPVTQALFSLRSWIGRLFRWERADHLIKQHSYLPKLTNEDREKSLVPPGQTAGISRVLYQFENEMLCEIINRTVHCFWVMASERVGRDYRLLMAVYVRKLNWFTPVYMAVITPILKWIICPSILRGIRKRWLSALPPQDSLTARTTSHST